MTGYKYLICICTCALALALAQVHTVFAVSDNGVDETESVVSTEVVSTEVESEVESETFIPVTPPDQPSDQDTADSQISGNGTGNDDSDLSDDSFLNPSIDEQLDYLDRYDVSGNSVSGNTVINNYNVTPLSDYDTYYGSISTTYLEYFRGYLSKLKYNEHYVASRVGQYEYIMAYGSNLNYDDSGYFWGDDVYVITIDTHSNGTFHGGIQTTFQLNPANYMVYSDLSPRYPSLATSADISLRQVVFIISIIIVFYTLTGLVRSGGIRWQHRRRRP